MRFPGFTSFIVEYIQLFTTFVGRFCPLRSENETGGWRKCKKMINNRTLYGLMAGALLSFGSCLGDGGSEVQVFAQPAIVKQVSGKKVLLIQNGSTVSSDDFAQRVDLFENDCGLINFRLDFASVANISRGDSGGVYTAENIDFMGMRRWDVSAVLTDTTLLTLKEQRTASVYEKSCMLDRHLFLFTTHPVELRDSLSMSYDVMSEPVVISGRRVYNLYLRVMGDTVRGGTTLASNSFDLSEFITVKSSVEKQAQKDSLFFRINYVTSVRDSVTPVWGTSSEFALKLSE